MGEYWVVACEYLFINRTVAGKLNYSAKYHNLVEWERPVQVDYWARLCQWAESQSGWKVTNKSKLYFIQLLMAADIDSTIHWNERQQSVNYILSCKQGICKVNWLLLSISDVLATFKCKTASNTVNAPFWKWVSTQCAWFLALHLGLSMCWIVARIYIRCICSIFEQNDALYLPCPIMKMSVNRVSTIFSILIQVMEKQSGCDKTWWLIWKCLLVKEKATWLLLHSEIEHQRSVNDFWLCILGYLGVDLW